MTDTRNQDMSPTKLAQSEKVPPAGKITYAEFLDWTDEDTHAEWVRGEIVMSSPASYQHQDIKGFLESVIRPFVEVFDLGVVLSAGFSMKLPDTGREPDLLFIGKTRLGQLRRTFLDGPADLAVEIISPESIRRDREDKFQEYAAAGVPEYWLIDPLEQRATFYQLDQNGQYREVAPDEAGRYYSQVISGFWLQVEWLWQIPLPAVQKALIKIGGQPYIDYSLKNFSEEGF